VRQPANLRAVKERLWCVPCATKPCGMIHWSALSIGCLFLSEVRLGVRLFTY
jgi:hypothetical protein